MARPVLSILMCTILSRQRQFSKLLKHINNQRTKDIEIIYSLDNKELPVGVKRQNLLEKAKGKYICFVDDDDWVPDYYIAEILKAAKKGKDCIGFLINCNINGLRSSAISSFKYKTWETNKDGFEYVRSIYHKTPVKRTIALKAGFPAIRFSEDAAYSKALLPYLKTETFINKVMYYYIYKTEPNNELRYGSDKYIEKTYGQHKEDLIIKKYFKGFKGTLLDIGANDGETLSNSRLFLENGWSGVLVEPSKTCLKRLGKLYKNNDKIQIVPFAVSDFCGEVAFYESGSHITENDHSLLSTINPKELVRWKGTKFDNHKMGFCKVVDVPTLLKKCKYKTFDYISVDAEGCDLLILKQLDLTNTKLICMEWNGIIPVREEIEKYCKNYGMTTIHKNGENLILAK